LTNNNGEIGSPCLTPLLQITFFPGTPFSRTEVEAECRMLSTNLTYFGPYPLALSMAMIAKYSTLLKAFSKSISR
jgi:hypothetical protein